MTTPSYELVNGEYRVAIPEPFWVPGWRHSWRTIFRWIPACYPCMKSFSTRQEYEKHYLKMHYNEASDDDAAGSTAQCICRGGSCWAVPEGQTYFTNHVCSLKDFHTTPHKCQNCGREFNLDSTFYPPEYVARNEVIRQATASQTVYVSGDIPNLTYDPRMEEIRKRLPRMTKEDVEFIKSMCFQGPDMTERQERRVRRIIDELRLYVSSDLLSELDRLRKDKI